MLVNSMIAAAAGLVLAAFYANKVLSIKVTDLRVEELSTAIRQGSMAFLKSSKADPALPTDTAKTPRLWFASG